MKKTLFLLIILSLSIINAPSAWSVTVTNTNNSGPGSLRDAMNNASPNEVIDFAPGVTGVITLASELTNNGNVPVDIQGPGPDVLTISGNNVTSQVFFFDLDSGTMKISGLTITQADGTGIINGQFGDLEIDNCVITQNAFDGIDADNKVTIRNTIISENEGSGIHVQGADLTIIDSQIIGNDPNMNGFSGGGIRTNSFITHTINIERTTISGNTSSEEGGGIQISGDVGTTLNITNSTISGNTVDISGGQVTDGGGGILVSDNTTVTILNSTITSNEALDVANASQGGGGIKINGSGVVNVKNTILAENSTSGTGSTDANFDCQGDFNSQGNNLIGIGDTGLGDCEGFSDGVMNDQVGSPATPLNPDLGPLGDNGGDVLTHALLSGSPAIDTGTNVGCPDVDARGTVRPLDGTGNGDVICDIGAVEAGRVDLQFVLDSLSNQKFQGIDPNQPINVSATITNPGPDFAPGLSVTGVMPPGVELVSATVGGQDCLLNSGQLQCAIGTLAKGDSLAVLLQLLFDNSDSVTVELTANTTGENIGTANVLSFTLDPSGGGNGGCNLMTSGTPGDRAAWFSLLILLLAGLYFRRFHRFSTPGTHTGRY